MAARLVKLQAAAKSSACSVGSVQWRRFEKWRGAGGSHCGPPGLTSPFLGQHIGASTSHAPVKAPQSTKGTEATLGNRVQTHPHSAAAAGGSPTIAHELVQGALVRWTAHDRRAAPPPTAVLLHGILGGRKNWGSFARRLAQEFPTWQFLLVDLRCHGESAGLSPPGGGAHTVESAALDVLRLVVQLRLVPHVLVGHSFGGKVALSMVEQASKPLARPVQVWVLDATPGKVRSGLDGEDAPAELIAALQAVPLPLQSRRAVVDELVKKGFSLGIAQWMTTNLKAAEGGEGFEWVFDLDGIASMYKSYEDTNLWRVVEDVPAGVHINFLRAERSLHRWHRDDVDRIHFAEQMAVHGGGAGGVQMHVLEDAGHWVHTDNPEGLFQILAPSFGVPEGRALRVSGLASQGSR